MVANMTELVPWGVGDGLCLLLKLSLFWSTTSTLHQLESTSATVMYSVTYRLEKVSTSSFEQGFSPAASFFRHSAESQCNPSTPLHLIGLIASVDLLKWPEESDIPR
jgi:hypothetical protein